MYYGRREPERIINTVDDIVNYGYSRWNPDQLVSDLVKLYSKLSSDNTTLSQTDQDKLVAMLIKGGATQSPIGRNSDKILNPITQNHLLSEKNITKIIKCCGKNTKYEWIENLIKLGYKLTEKQQTEIIINGYKKGLTLIMDQETATYVDLETICKTSPLSIVNLDRFLTKFKLVPTINHLNIAIKSNSFSTKINNAPNNTSNVFLDDVILCFLNHGLEFNLELFLFIIDKVFIDPAINIQLYTYTDSLFLNKMITSMNIFDTLLKTKTNIFIKNLYVILELVEKYNLEHDDNIYEKLITQTFYNSVANNDGYVRGKFTNYPYDHDKQYGANLTRCIDLLIKLNYVPNIKHLEHACEVGDELTFDKLYIKLNTFTDKCLIGACKSSSINILHKLFSMKAIPNYECVKALPNGASVILTVLLQNGLLIDMSIVELCLKKTMVIHNLDDFGIPYDLELYKLCHKYSSFNPHYIDKIKTNINGNNIHYELRNKIKYNYNENEIIEEIKKINYADDMMYDDAVSTNKQLIVEYLEANWGLKPNLKTLALIPNNIQRMEYLEKLKALGIISEPVFETVALTPTIPVKLDEANIDNVVQSPSGTNIIPTKKVVKKTIVKAKKLN